MVGRAMSRTRILLTHSPAVRANYYGAEALEALRACGEVVLNPHDVPPAGDALAALAQDCAIIVADRQTGFEAATFATLPSVVAVLRCAMDISTIDVEAASRHGVLVTRATPGFGDAVAELALGYMIDLGRGIGRASAAFQAGRTPEVRRGVQLAGATVGIIGYGTIGQRLAALCRALGMDVLVTDPGRSVAEPGLRQVPLATLLAEATFVVCLAPAIPATRGLMDRAAFAAMAPGSYFLNLSRGSLVDEAALAAALDSGQLAGAALDVGSAPDEMPPPALARRPDVIATPHIGGLTPQAAAHQAFDTVRQASALVAGRVPPGAVNAERATRLARLGIAVAG
jgi:D-3-phosphoglycerate dehydrogenase / 2-oxoglutarate reductase